MTRQRYDLYLLTPALGVAHAADVVVLEEGAALQRVGFRYRPDYLATAGALAIDPVQLPLTDGEVQLECQGGTPAFIDDYLPDAWGRKVLAQMAWYREQRKLNAHSVIDSLAMLGSSRIGAISLVPQGGVPHLNQGHHLGVLEHAEQAAQQIDRDDFDAADIDEMGLLYLANAGTGVGGARPKALLYDDKGCYLAKFNRRSQDEYNNARVELACLRMARAAGLAMHDGRVVPGINGREVLLLDRFDVAEGGRHHLITANGLLKDPGSQRDPGHAFRYDDVCELLRRHSVHIEQDLARLLGLMLFNRAINNTDDHERNFSLIHRGDGYCLAPAYDLVPSVVTGAFHAAGFADQPSPPRPSEALRLGRVFGLPKPVVARVAEQVSDAVGNWQSFAEQAGVEASEAARIERCFRL